MLSDPREEIYAKMRARGMIPAKAAIAAGYALGSAVYTRLESDDEVITRIRELILEREVQLATAGERAKTRVYDDPHVTLSDIASMCKRWVAQYLYRASENLRSK